MNQKISISKDYLGIEKNISLYDDGKIRSCSQVENESFIYGQSFFHERDISDIIPCINETIEPPFSAGLEKSFREIYKEVNWLKALGKDRFVGYVHSFLTSLDSKIRLSDPMNYLEVISKEREIMSLLEPSHIDMNALNHELSKRESAILSSLIPVDGNQCKVVRYSHASQTGRLTVSDGPKVLLLSKEDRRIFVPKKKGNVLAQIDFVSLEPRVAYLLTHNESPRDIYELMGQSIGKDTPRAKLKIATISSLYGSSKSDPTISKKVFDFFKIEEIKNKFLSNDCLYNLYGRPLNPGEESLRLPHYIQSTAVDVSLAGMLQFAKSFDVTPYFMIHDSLVFETSEEEFRKLSKENLTVDIEKLGTFYMSVSRFGSDN